MKKILLTLFLATSFWFGFSQESYSLSPESILTIEGTSTVHDWTVTANTKQGSLKTEGPLPKEIDFQVRAADIKSERGATMDKKMHDALKSEEHPNVTFTLKEVKNQDVLMGTLTIAGQANEVEIEGIITPSNNTLKITGEKKIVLKDFGIEPPTAMFGQVIVGDEVVVKFNLIFEKS
ncbi:MAG: YceI family protein [Flavobacteriaceae bacterium]